VNLAPRALAKLTDAMKITIEIDLDLGRLRTNKEEEIAKIFFHLAKEIKFGQSAGVPIYDSKERFVGFYKLTEEPLS
jgi:hypothetical protein